MVDREFLCYHKNEDISIVNFYVKDWCRFVYRFKLIKINVEFTYWTHRHNFSSLFNT